MTRTLLVTGGAGFIGSNFVLDAVLRRGERVINLDLLTYAGNPDNLREVDGHAGHVFVQGSIADRALVMRLLNEHRPDAVVNFAAESHVDRSIDGPGDFVQTNVVGTFELLEATRAHLASLPADVGARFRFVHVSTDEVFGSLGSAGYFDERSPYAPNSPYAASKASADHLVRAYHHTYGMPVVTTNCSNNYGPHQFPEKLLPLMILNAKERKRLPVYGDGRNVRDWIYVGDHCAGVRAALDRGRPGETYLLGGRSERENLHVVRSVCAILDRLAPLGVGATDVEGKSITSHQDLITFVKDRPGHDRRYAVDPSKAEQQLGWKPEHAFEAGLEKTVRWYLEHRDWCERITQGVYRRERLGLGAAS